MEGGPRSDGEESQVGSQEGTSGGGAGTIEGAEGGGRVGGGKECEDDSGRVKNERDSTTVEAELEEERG